MAMTSSTATATQLEAASARLAGAPHDPAAALEVGVMLVAANRHDEAVAPLTIATRGDVNGGTWRILAMALLASKRPGEAAAAFEHALRKDPKDVSLWLNVAQAWQDAKDPAQAMRALRSYADKRGDAAGFGHLGTVLTTHGDMMAALDAFDRAEKLDAQFFARAPAEAAARAKAQALTTQGRA